MQFEEKENSNCACSLNGIKTDQNETFTKYYFWCALAEDFYSTKSHGRYHLLDMLKGFLFGNKIQKRL